MALFSASFSFDTPSSRPDSLYTYDTPSDSISPTSSRCTTPSSPITTAPSSSNSSTDDLFTLTAHLSSSTIYPSHSRSLLPGRRSPPRSTPFALPPSCAAQQSSSMGGAELLARRERRQAYTAEQMSGANRRKLSLLVARMLGDEIPCTGSRKHPNDGLHPSNVRVVPAMPPTSACSSRMQSRRNTLVEQLSMEDEEDVMDEEESGIVPSIEGSEWTLPVRTRESANRVSKRSCGKASGKKVMRGAKR